MHVAYGAITEEGHRPMRNAAVGLDLGPPHAAMADADAIDVERFRDDEGIDAGRGKPAARRRVTHAAVAHADAAEVEGFRDDDVIDARRGKPAALRQIMHAAVAPRLFVDGAGDL